MLTLILISSLSFLILVIMISLRWFNCSFTSGSVCFKVFKKGDSFINRQFSILKKSSGVYKILLTFFVFIKKSLLFQIIKFYNGIILLLRRLNKKVGKFLKKATVEKSEENVSEYLRNVSEYKDQE